MAKTCKSAAAAALVATAALLLVLLEARPALAREQGTEQERKACMPDVSKLCNAFIPNPEQIIACLRFPAAEDRTIAARIVLRGVRTAVMHAQILERARTLTPRYVANASHSWASADQASGGWNRPTGWNVKGPAIRAWGQYHSRVLDRRASAGCCEGATAEKAVPFPSDCPSIPNSSCVR